MTTNFKNNKSLCIFPWIENYQGSRYERKYCCVSDDLKGLEKIEVLVNSNKFNTLMKYILKQSIIIKSISNYFNDCSIYFFENNQRKNDLFKEIFNNLHLQKKILNV